MTALLGKEAYYIYQKSGRLKADPETMPTALQRNHYAHKGTIITVRELQ